MIRRLAPLLVLAAAVVGAPATAQVQPPYLVELSTGSTGSPAAQYVAILATSGAELAGARLTVQDSQGNPLADFVDLGSSIPVSSSGYVLVATAESEQAYAIAAGVLAANPSLRGRPPLPLGPEHGLGRGRGHRRGHGRGRGGAPTGARTGARGARGPGAPRRGHRRGHGHGRGRRLRGLGPVPGAERELGVAGGLRGDSGHGAPAHPAHRE